MSQILRLICGTEVSHHSWKYRHLHNKWSNFCCQQKGTVRPIMNRPYSFFVSQMKALGQTLQSTYKMYGIISLPIHPDTLKSRIQCELDCHCHHLLFTLPQCIYLPRYEADQTPDIKKFANTFTISHCRNQAILKKVFRKWGFSCQVCVARGAAVAFLNGSFHSKETLTRKQKMQTGRQTLKIVEQRRKDGLKKGVIERKEHTGISTGCIQPQAAVKQPNVCE